MSAQLIRCIYIFCGLLACSHASFAGFVETSPTLPSLKESLDEASRSSPNPADSDLRISYNKQVLLEKDAVSFQKKTQFAELNVSNAQLLQNYKADQQQQHSYQPRPDQIEALARYEQASQSSTLNAHLLDIAHSDTLPSKSNVKHTANGMDDSLHLSSSRYRDTWSTISSSQYSHRERWDRTQRQKHSAYNLNELGSAVPGDKSTELTLDRLPKDSRPTYSSKVHTLPKIPNGEDASQREWVDTMMPYLAKKVANTGDREKILQTVYKNAIANQVKPDLVLAIIHIESNFQRNAKSIVGAQGLMQVMPFWKQELGNIHDNLYDIETNIRYGCYILRHYLDRENGRLIPALARYNGSYGKDKYPNKVLHSWLNHWKHY